MGEGEKIMLTSSYCRKKLKEIEQTLELIGTMHPDYREHLLRMEQYYKTELVEAIKREPKPIDRLYTKQEKRERTIWERLSD